MQDLITVGEQTLHYLRRPHEHVPAHVIESPAAWRARDLADRPGDWTGVLAATQIGEHERADESGRPQPMSQVERSNFPLPTLESEIDRWREQLATGLGLVLVRGLPVEAWGEEKSSFIYWGLGCHLGRPGVQNELGELLGHVRDTGESARDPNVRLYKTAARIAYHCDAADVVGLLCLRTAKRGGESRIASSVSVFNVLLAEHPDLAARLFDPVLLDVRSESETSGLRHFPVPPCRFAAGRLRTFYHSDYFRSVVRHDDVPPLDETLQRLYDTWESIAASPALYYDMALEPGDIQLISNHTVVHSRTQYEDHAAPDRRRHLLRLWLSL
jgi:hypothetical protein